MFQLWRARVVILMAVVLLLVGSVGHGQEKPEEILIGTAISLTGKESLTGACAKNAYELAIKEVNDKGGVEIRDLGRKLRVTLIVYDDESNPEKSASLTERLITEDKVDALLGGYTTPIVEPQTEVAEKHHIPFVNGGGAASHIYSKGYRWIFGTLSSGKRGAITLMDFIREQLREGNLPKPLKIAMVWEKTSWGEDCRDGVRQQVEEFPESFEIVLDESFREMATDFTQLLNEVKSASADVFLCIPHLADFMLMHRQYTELGLSHLLVSYVTRGSEEIAREKFGPAVDYLVTFTWWSKEMPYPQVKEFINKYEAAYGRPPEWDAGGPYEAARALFQAIEDAGSLDKAEIRDALTHLELTNSILVGQRLSFGENGQADYPLLIIQNRPDGTSPIVYPADVALAEATVPRPRVRFGCALSLSGELEEEGRLTKEGYELWKEHLNSQGGILIGNDRYLIDILYYDDESNPQKTASLVERLITEDKVDFLLGPYGSSATFEAAALAEKYRVPMVEGEGPAEKIFTQGFRYTFGLLSSSRDYFQNILEGAASLEPKPNRVAILSTDVPYLYIAEGAEQHAKRLGFEVIPLITVEKGDDLSSILSDLKDDSPNMVLFSAPFGEALSFVKTAKAVGLSPKMFGIIVAPCDPAFVEQLGKDADYIFGPCQWTSDLPYDGPVFGSPQDYARLFREKFGKEPEYHSAAATACGVTYQLALGKASSLDCEDVKDALASLDAMTFYGRIKFNEQGRDIYNPMVAVQIQKGKIVTVWPWRLATGSPKYPTPPWEEREPVLKVAVLYCGSIEDQGWCYEGHLGAQRMAEALPYVELSEREEACDPDALQMMREYAEAGYGVIFGHGPEFGEYIKEIAPDYPDVIFMWGDGVEKKAPNAGIYFERMYEGRFLTGMVAGAMTKTNKIGYAAALPVSEVVRGIDAFAKGVASVNPGARVYVEWIGEWYNLLKEKEVTLSLVDEGCDVITHHTDSYAPGEAAEERGVYFISYHSDMRRFAPHVFLTGTVWNWAPVMTDVVEAVREGTWDEYPGQDWWYGLAEGGVKLAPFSDLVPEDVREMVEEKKQAIIKGEFEVFPGMTDEELREIYYFESNVVLLSVLTGCAKEKPIKLGHIGDYSGICEMYSTSEKKGQLLAIEEINAAGGILGRPLEYLDRDGALNVDIGVRELKNLILREKIDFALGPCSSSEALALQAVTGDYNIIRVSSIACTEAQTVDNYNGTTLQVVVNTYMEGRGQARRIHRDFPNAKKFYCFNQDYEFGYREQAAFEEEIKRLVPDAVIVGKAFPKLGETDYSPFITAMLAMKDDIDFVQSSLYGDDLVVFTKQAKGYGFFDELPFIALYDIDVLKALGKDVPEGVYGFARGDFFADPNLKMMEFVEKYRAKYNGEYPSGWAVLGYDAIYALKAAIEKAGTTDTDAVREALKGMDFTGLRGYTPVRAIDLMMVAPTYNGIISRESPYPFPIWRDVWRIDGAEVIRAEESVLEVRAAFKKEEREPELKVAVLYCGSIEDQGWCYEGHLGAQQTAEELPYVGISEREEACGPDAPQILREYAKAGNKVILCHSYNFGEYIEEVAPDYPDVIFMWGAGVEKKAPNAGIYFGRMYEAKFLAGIVAGATTKTNKIGYAAALPTSEVVRGIDAFAKGAASVNPDAKVYVEWIGEWYNPPKEKEVTLSLIDRGCDIITHHSDSYAPGEAAEEGGVYYISFGSDMRRFAPHVFLTGTVWNWAPIMTDIVKAVREGTWDQYPGQDWWYGLAEGGVQLALFSDLVPDNVKEMVEEKKQAIIEGDFEVFPGMTDEELREIYYFEPNVVGKLPSKEANESIKIGAIYPLTGSLATTGTDIENGIMLAVDVINYEYDLNLPLAKSKGIGSLNGAKIEVIFGDSQGSPSIGSSEAARLVNEEKVVTLIGCYQSSVAAEASQAAEDKGVPFLSPMSCAPSLTERGFRWFFRTGPSDKIFVQNFYEFLQDIQEEKDIEVEKLGIVYEDSLWGPEFAEHAEQYAEEYGYQVVEKISYSADATNVTNEVRRIKDARPDVVLQASYINDAILYMRTYKEMNFNPDAILADDAGFLEPEFLQTLGEEGNYILTRQTWSRDLAEVKPLLGIVNQMFRERYGTNMTGNSARAFTGMLVLADAINRAGSTDPEAIREALLETNIPADKLIMPWDGVKFDQETHQNTLGKGIICQIIDQEYYTVWPWNLATKELIWPMPKWEERE